MEIIERLIVPAILIVVVLGLSIKLWRMEKKIESKFNLQRRFNEFYIKMVFDIAHNSEDKKTTLHYLN